MPTGSLVGAYTEEQVLEGVKKILNVEGFKYDETVLPAYLKGAVAAVGHHIGPLTQRTVAEVVSAGTDGRLVLSSWPVVSVTTVTGRDGASLTGATIDHALGVLTWALGDQRPTPGRPYAVTYEAGYGEVPDDIWLAIVEMVRHLFRNFRAVRPGTRDPVAAPSMGARAGIPPAVVTLLEPHHVPGVA